ncbi:uncharacterized protein [Clytia hemisphaerica]|uniref:uncharacterized protein n=1 Tax=Clytia hemisphaerica TaxID=252671 RepID=UPI0034D431FA
MENHEKLQKLQLSSINATNATTIEETTTQDSWETVTGNSFATTSCSSASFIVTPIVKPVTKRKATPPPTALLTKKVDRRPLARNIQEDIEEEDEEEENEIVPQQQESRASSPFGLVVSDQNEPSTSRLTSDRSSISTFVGTLEASGLSGVLDQPGPSAPRLTSDRSSISTFLGTFEASDPSDLGPGPSASASGPYVASHPVETSSSVDDNDVVGNVVSDVPSTPATIKPKAKRQKRICLYDDFDCVCGKKYLNKKNLNKHITAKGNNADHFKKNPYPPDY